MRQIFYLTIWMVNLFKKILYYKKYIVRMKQLFVNLGWWEHCILGVSGIALQVSSSYLLHYLSFILPSCMFLFFGWSVPPPCWHCSWGWQALPNFPNFDWSLKNYYWAEYHKKGKAWSTCCYKIIRHKLFFLLYVTAFSFKSISFAAQSYGHAVPPEGQ